MIREQITSKGNCFIYKYYIMNYDDCIQYEVDIYKEHGITSERIFYTSSSASTLKRLLQIIGQWELYHNQYM